jgi:hypothetical protein
MTHVSGGCASLYVDDRINHRFLQRLFSLRSVNGLFDFPMAFPGPGEIGNKIMGAHHAAVLDG